jgi:hypothetical protein
MLALLRGRLAVRHRDDALVLRAGDFAILPACLERVGLQAETAVEFLQIQLGTG